MLNKSQPTSGKKSVKIYVMWGKIVHSSIYLSLSAQKILCLMPDNDMSGGNQVMHKAPFLAKIWVACPPPHHANVRIFTVILKYTRLSVSWTTMESTVWETQKSRKHRAPQSRGRPGCCLQHWSSKCQYSTPAFDFYHTAHHKLLSIDIKK